MNKLLKIALTICSLIAGFSVSAQELTAETKLDTNIILIGDQINLLLEVRNSTEYQVSFPVLEDTLVEGIEILEKSAIDTIAKKGSDTIVYRQNLVITSFDSGYYALRPFKFLLNNDTSLYIETEPLLLEVRTVPVDMAADIKDVKEPLSLPISWKQIAIYVGIGLLIVLILAAILIFVIIRKKPEDFKNMVQRKPLPPHEIAYAKLQTLKERKLWQAGMVKEYHSDISEIIREYLEKRYDFNALEQVSDEIITEMRDRIDEEVLKKLGKILELSDLAKFAKLQPLPDENELSMNYAVQLVDATKPVQLPQEKAKPAGQAVPESPESTEQKEEEKPKEE